MRKIELLAPAKDLECGKAAIDCGADAVYIGASKFGARSAVGNSLEDIAQLIEYAHKYWARVYVTLNTILFDDELKEAERMIHELYKLGADALIVQDMGILEMDLPPIPLHASTQTHNYDLERIQFMEQAGFERIILARELSAQQLQTIGKSTSAELEYFIHGALCVSLSGQCYFSHAINGRSANRGECSQPCRMKYSLEDNTGKVLAKDKHLLSLKDLNLTKHLEEIIKTGVCSFKIEGRLKDINYIKNITSHYRKCLDDIIYRRSDLQRASSGTTSITFNPDPERSFNRGFTPYFFGERIKDIANFLTPKSMGKKVGSVKAVHKDHFIFDGDYDLHNGDGLCFFNDKNILSGISINKVDGKRVYPNDMSPVIDGAILYRNLDHDFSKKLKKENPQRKINVSLHLMCTSEGLTLQATDDDSTFVSHHIEGKIDQARNEAMAQDNLNRQLSKSGDSIFSVNEVTMDLDFAPFVPARQLNDLRRQTLDKLEQERIKQHPHSTNSPSHNHPQYPSSQLNYMGNVTNKLAHQFYTKCGVTSIEQGFELQSEFEGKVLMTTRHCLRFQFGLCPKQGQTNQQITEPLFLTDSKNRYQLQFDCKNCVMKILK